MRGEDLLPTASGGIRRIWWSDVDAGYIMTEMPGFNDRVSRHSLMGVESSFAENCAQTVWPKRISPEFWDWLPDQ